MLHELRVLSKRYARCLRWLGSTPGIEDLTRLEGPWFLLPVFRRPCVLSFCVCFVITGVFSFSSLFSSSPYSPFYPFLATYFWAFAVTCSTFPSISFYSFSCRLDSSLNGLMARMFVSLEWIMCVVINQSGLIGYLIPSHVLCFL